jgi:SAM-dependent methyltransferase
MIDSKRMQWEEIVCDWCGTPGGELLFSGPDRGEMLPGEFRMVRCTKCNLIRQNPRPSWKDLSSYYPENYHAYFSLVGDDRKPLRRLNKRYAQWKLRQAIEKHQTSGFLLEVGCGTGLFLEEMARTGKWQLIGIEPEPRAASYVKKELGITVMQERLSEVKLDCNAFDVIVLWNVLEHLSYPIQDLKKIHLLLKGGGSLVFSIPNLEGLGAKIFRHYWIGWDLPRHLYLFPKSRLYKILDELGFNVVATKCISNSYATLGLSLKFWSQSWEDRYPALKRFLINLYHTRFIRALLVFPLSILDLLKFSSVITIIANKRK